MNKNIPRIYVKDILIINQILFLSKNNIHYIKKVLRLNIKDTVEIFNDTNHIFLAKIMEISNKIILVKILKKELKNIESPIHIHLGQVISKSEKMDFTIQKSTEMGVNVITPLFSEYCNYKNKSINISHKIKRWEKIAISACRQCHRNITPIINYTEDIFSWCKKNEKEAIKILFHPKSKSTINCLPTSIKYIQMIIGPEGGFSDYEIKKITKYGFISIKLGPRVLRTETAALAAITALQIKFGDLIV